MMAAQLTINGERAGGLDWNPATPTRRQDAPRTVAGADVPPDTSVAGAVDRLSRVVQRSLERIAANAARPPTA